LTTTRSSIAIIIPGGVGTGRDNIGVPVLEQIIELLSRDFNVTVFQLFKTNQGYQPAGFELVEVYSTNFLLKYLKLFFKFRSLHRKKAFKVVHGFWALPNGVFAVAFGKLFGIKSVVSVLGGDAIARPEIKYGQLQRSSYRKLIFWALRHADEANALTQYLINNLRNAGFERVDFKVIPWGIDNALFRYRSEEPAKPIHFLHIGNLHPVKDQTTLLHAFDKIRKSVPARLLIIGEGVYENVIRELIVKLNLEREVTIIGLVPYRELHKFYHEADILLHTSVSEGQCEVVTEAMCSGVVVCGTKVGLMHDLPDCCASVDVGDYHALAKETLSLIENPQRMIEVRSRARNWSEVHTIHWTVKKYNDCYLTRT
jgi:glycosyltransferase involved in cell wall biosynthesis